MKTPSFILSILVVALVGALVGCAPPTSNQKGDDKPSSSQHDGTQAAPVLLTLGTQFSGKIGASSDLSNSESFYKFETAASTSVLLAVSQASPAHTGADDWDVRLYSDAAMSSQVGLVSPNDHISPYFTGLTANTMYYLKVLNKTASATTFKLTVQDPPTFKNEGSSASPALLFFLGGSVDTEMFVTSTLADTSYYAFTAPATGTATISYPEGILDATVYSSKFTGTPVGEETSNSTKTLNVAVTKDSAYYLKIQHWGSGTTRISGDLTITIE